MTDPDLYFIRHGQTDWNAQGRFQGHSDIALNDRGRVQVDQIAARLRQHLEQENIEAVRLEIITSPLLRARQTAIRIARALDRADDMIVIEPALIELSFGRWEGMNTAEIKAVDNAHRRARKVDRWAIAPPGGESYAQGAVRIGAWLAARQGDAVIVTHSGIMRIVSHLAGALLAPEAAIAIIPHDRILNLCGHRARWL